MLSATLSGAFVYVLGNPSPTSTYYAEEGIYPGAPTYTIWREDSTYYAKDANGHIVYMSSNYSSIIKNLADSVANTSSGNSIHHFAGKYNLDVGVAFDFRTSGSGNLTLSGEHGATIIATEELEAPVWSCFFEFYGGKNILIKGLTFNDNQQGTASALRFGGYASTNNTEVTQCSFYNFIDSSNPSSGYGIAIGRGNNHNYHANYFENCEQGIVVAPYQCTINNTQIHDNTFVGCGHSINCEASTNGEFLNLNINNNELLGSELYSRPLDSEPHETCYINVYGHGNSYGLSISGNTIVALPNENATGIRVTVYEHPIITGNVVLNANYSDGESPYQSYCAGIYVRGCSYASVSSNTIANSSGGIVLQAYSGDPVFCSIIGNTIHTIFGYGLYVHRTSESVFVGNTIYVCNDWGIYENPTYYAYENNNTYIGCSAKSCTSGGISVDSDAHVCCSWNETDWISEYPTP